MNTYPTSFSTLSTSGYKPLLTVQNPKTFINSKDFWIFFIGGLLQIIGMIVITFRNPSDGQTDSDTTFLWVGWGVFAIGTGIVIFQIFSKVNFAT